MCFLIMSPSNVYTEGAYSDSQFSPTRSVQNQFKTHSSRRMRLVKSAIIRSPGFSIKVSGLRGAYTVVWILAGFGNHRILEMTPAPALPPDWLLSYHHLKSTSVQVQVESRVVTAVLPILTRHSDRNIPRYEG